MSFTLPWVVLAALACRGADPAPAARPAAPRHAPPAPGSAARAAPDTSGRAWRRITVDGDRFPDARCNDGTVPVLFVQRGDASEAGRWLLWFKGGESCSDAEDCRQRAPELKSARPWQNRDLGQGDAEEGRIAGILSDDPAENPDFHGWNKAYLVYCTSDDWMGTARAGENPVGLSFTGRQVLDGMVGALSDPAVMGEDPTLGAASEVLVTGSSAGEKGVLANVDRLAAGPLKGAKVRAILDAALLSREADPARVRVELEQRRKLWNARSDDDCEAAHRTDAAMCMMPDFVIAGHFLQTDAFWHQDQLDPKLLAGGADPRAQSERVRRLIAGVDHGFAPRFGAHTILNAPRFARGEVDGTTMAEAVGSWYFGRPGPTKVIDPADGPAQKRR